MPYSAMMTSNSIEPLRFLRIREELRVLYHGHTVKAVRFQRTVLLVDLSIILFFIAGPVLRGGNTYIWIDIGVAIVLAADIVTRSLASTDLWRWLRQPTTIVDLFVLVRLLLPIWLSNFGFLRILRLWSLSRSGFLWRPLRKRGLERWEETGRAIVNLLTFLFVVASFVFTFFAGEETGIAGYVDALYFTVTSVTTTGYGDIVLPGTWGKLVSIVVMIVGISLFVRLAQAVVRPHKVYFPCPQCGLNRHDPDAVHCKACGHMLNIPGQRPLLGPPSPRETSLNEVFTRSVSNKAKGHLVTDMVVHDAAHVSCGPKQAPTGFALSGTLCCVGR